MDSGSISRDFQVPLGGTYNTQTTLLSTPTRINKFVIILTNLENYYGKI